MNVRLERPSVVKTVRINKAHTDASVDLGINLEMITHPVLVSCFLSLLHFGFVPLLG